MPKAQRHFRHKHTSHPSPPPQPWHGQPASGQKPQRYCPATPPVNKGKACCYGSLRPLLWSGSQFLFLISQKTFFYYSLICCSSAAIYSSFVADPSSPHMKLGSDLWHELHRCCSVGSVGQWVGHHFGSDWNTSTTITWIALHFVQTIMFPWKCILSTCNVAMGYTFFCILLESVCADIHSWCIAMTLWFTEFCSFATLTPSVSTNILNRLSWNLEQTVMFFSKWIVTTSASSLFLTFSI